MPHFAFTRTDSDTGRSIRWKRTRDNSMADAPFVWTFDDGSTREPTDDEMTEYANRDNDY